MKELHLSSGAVHTLPNDLEHALFESKKAHIAWEDITPLARNEWICWITDAKKDETRKKRIRIGVEQLASGKRRPCCWPGCKHRTKKKD